MHIHIFVWEIEKSVLKMFIKHDYSLQSMIMIAKYEIELWLFEMKLANNMHIIRIHLHNLVASRLTLQGQYVHIAWKVCFCHD